jgi:polar amino acid transport system substrate-binding protein
LQRSSLLVRVSSGELLKISELVAHAREAKTALDGPRIAPTEPVRGNMLKIHLMGLMVLASALMTTPSQAGEIPAAIKASGVLHLSINTTYPPLDFTNPSTAAIVGVDVDLADAVASKLGLKIEWTEVPFAQLIPSLKTKRSDFIWSGIGDLPSRQDTMDFVDYLETGTQFYTLTTAAYQAPEDLCGMKVGSIRSTHYPADIADWSAGHCVKAGKPPIEFVAGENSPDVRTQLKQGRIDAAAQGSETIPYLSEQDGGVFKLLGTPITTAYTGIAFDKDDTAFRDLIADTLQGMITDGSYGKILAKWHLSQIAIPAITINGKPRS